MTFYHLKRLLPILAIACLSGCGKKPDPKAADAQPEPQIPTQTEAAAAAESAAEKARQATAAHQQALVDEAIVLIGRVADAAISVKDADTAKAAAELIDAIDAEFQTLSEKMTQAGNPPPDLQVKFRKQHDKASAAMAARIGDAMPDLERQPELAQLLNRLFKNFSKTLAHPAFVAYGIDGG